MTKLMENKRGLIMGVANDHSIAWGIAKALADAGAELAFTYQGEALKRRVVPLAESLGSNFVLPCDVTDTDCMDTLFSILKQEWGSLDFVVHAIAFSDKNELQGRYVDTTAENFDQSMRISVYSFTDVCRRASELMPNGGSLLTLSYIGAEKYIPNYNVMGVAKAALEASVHFLAFDLGKQNIRVNAISAGPIRTLAASGIDGLRNILEWNKINSALRRNVTIDDIGQSALYLLSDMSSGVTSEVVHVDAGMHKQGMINADSTSALSELLGSF
ncbi:MAG: SDR family oxidoreductase [Alphaproteobacteria bacterium]|nr:SDR family oxidoreductase [Alphaproteobacteria bacterium]